MNKEYDWQRSLGLLSYKTICLERFEAQAQTVVSKYIVDDMFANPVVFDARTDMLMEDLVFKLRAFVYGEQTVIKHTKYPSNWKEAVKERFFPHWALRRWPVEYTEVVFDVKTMYPEISVPDAVHRTHVELYERVFKNDG